MLTSGALSAAKIYGNLHWSAALVQQWDWLGAGANPVAEGNLVHSIKKFFFFKLVCKAFAVFII